MSEREILYQNLPETFSPKEALGKVIELEFKKDWMKSRTWIQSVIDSWMFHSKIERIERGIYRKLNTRRT